MDKNAHPQNTQFNPYSQFFPNFHPMYGQIPPYPSYCPFPSQPNPPNPPPNPQYQAFPPRPNPPNPPPNPPNLLSNPYSEGENSEKRIKASVSGAYISSSNPNTSDDSERSRPISKKGKSKLVEKNESSTNEESLATFNTKMGEVIKEDIGAKRRKVEALEKIARAKEINAQAIKEAKAMEILSKETLHMDEEDKRKHELLCQLLIKKYFYE